MLMNRKYLSVSVSLSLLVLIGCAPLAAPLAHLPFGLRKKQEPPVAEILCLWQPGQGRDTNGLPTRGFAGQLFFFGMGEKAPIDVEGGVKIYVFDDHNPESERGKPLHIFDFAAGAWQNYEVKSNIGKAYQIFIPYTRPGTHHAQCTLRVKYTNEKGQSVFSDSGTVILAGTKPEEPVQEQTVSAADNQHSKPSAAAQQTSDILTASHQQLNTKHDPATEMRIKALETVLAKLKNSEPPEDLPNRVEIVNETIVPAAYSEPQPRRSISHRSPADLTTSNSDTETHPLLRSEPAAEKSSGLKVYSIPLSK